MGLCLAACGPEAADRLYVASGLTDQVLVLDAETGAELDNILVERRRDEVDEPHGLASSPDGRHWYATVSHGEPTLWKFESGSDRLVGRVTLPTGGAARIGITPDSRRAFVPDYDRSNPGAVGRVAVIELEALTVVAAPEVCPGPHHAAVSPDGTLVAVACSLSDEIVILDAATLEPRGRFFVDAEPGVAGEPRFKPLNLAWAPDGSVVYASLHLAAQLRAFTVSGENVGAADVGAGPAQIEITPDGVRLLSANRGDESLSILSSTPLEETARIELGAPHPHGLALDEPGRRAFVTCEGDVRTQGRVVAVDLTTGRPLWSVQAGAYLLGVLYR